MGNDAPATGRRYSFNYLRSDLLLRDSETMRHRLASSVERIFPNQMQGDSPAKFLAKFLEQEIGVEMYKRSSWRVDWHAVFKRLDIKHVLDSITLIRFYLNRGDEHHEAKRFVEICKRIFDEEGVGYQVDLEGGVHPHVDEQFERTRAATIARLNGPFFKAARSHIEACEKAMLANPFDGRQAVRSTFDLLENLVKLRFPRETHLKTSSIERHIKPVFQGKFEGAELSASMKHLDAFSKWMEAAHFYRHDPGSPEPSHPSEELSIQFVSSGFSFARWLAPLLFPEKYE